MKRSIELGLFMQVCRQLLSFRGIEIAVMATMPTGYQEELAWSVEPAGASRCRHDGGGRLHEVLHLARDRLPVAAAGVPRAEEVRVAAHCQQVHLLGMRCSASNIAVSVAGLHLIFRWQYGTQLDRDHRRAARFAAACCRRIT